MDNKFKPVFRVAAIIKIVLSCLFQIEKKWVRHHIILLHYVNINSKIKQKFYITLGINKRKRVKGFYYKARFYNNYVTNMNVSTFFAAK